MLIYGNLEVEKYKYENILENIFFFWNWAYPLEPALY